MEKNIPETPIVHSFTEKSMNLSNSMKDLSMKNSIIVLVIIAFFGVGTGLMLSKITPQNNGGSSLLPGGGSVSKGKVVGTGDTKIFKDTAEGVLKDGGIEGEGQYHLVRPGGDSQNVYLTSSLVDLSQFMGKKIKVWGETQQAQHAGWLMDVGKVEVL